MISYHSIFALQIGGGGSLMGVAWRGEGAGVADPGQGGTGKPQL